MIDNSIEKAFFKYREALNYLLGKFNALADYYEIYTKDNPIEYVKGRIKKIDSIEEKIKIRKRFPGIDESQSIINYLDKLHDIVGVRIVCSYLSDMEEIIKSNVNSELKIAAIINIIKSIITTLIKTSI